MKTVGHDSVLLTDENLIGKSVKTHLKQNLMEECNLHTNVRLPNSVFKPYANIGTNLLFFEKGEATKQTWFYQHRVPDGQKSYSMTKPIRLEHLQPCVNWWGGPERRGRVENEVAWCVTAEEIRERGFNLDFRNPHAETQHVGDPEVLLAELDEAEREVARLRDEMRSILEEALLR